MNLDALPAIYGRSPPGSFWIVLPSGEDASVQHPNVVTTVIISCPGRRRLLLSWWYLLSFSQRLLSVPGRLGVSIFRSLIEQNIRRLDHDFFRSTTYKFRDGEPRRNSNSRRIVRNISSLSRSEKEPRLFYFYSPTSPGWHGKSNQTGSTSRGTENQIRPVPLWTPITTLAANAITRP